VKHWIFPEKIWQYCPNFLGNADNNYTKEFGDMYLVNGYSFARLSSLKEVVYCCRVAQLLVPI